LAANDLAAKYRSQFSVFENVTYLNSCSQGALANSVKQSFAEYLSTLELQGSAWGDWTAAQEKVRVLTARFFNVPATEMAITTSASAGVSSVASALNFNEGRNKVVTTNNEFPTIGQIWHAQ
jgi:kynureninase